MARRKASRPAANGKGATRPAKRRRVANTDAEDEKSDATLAMLNALLEGVLILAKEVGHVSAAGHSASRRARNLMTSISDALPEDPAIQTLDFDGHRKHIGSVLERLKRVCGTDCVDDFKDQWDYMREISEDIAQWLPNIWDVLAGGDLFLARTCIVCCAEAVQSIRNAGTACVRAILQTFFAPDYLTALITETTTRIFGSQTKTARRCPGRILAMP